MKKLLTIVTLLAFFAAQQGIGESMFDASSQESSPDTSFQDSSRASSEGSSQYTTDNSSNSQNSSEATTDGSNNSEPSSVAFVAVGAVVSIALTVGGILLTVSVSRARQEEVLRLQDQIYMADGKDYREILSFFELEDRDLIGVNDQLVAAGRQIGSDQEAADYLAALFMALTKKSGKVQYQLNML